MSMFTATTQNPPRGSTPGFAIRAFNAGKKSSSDQVLEFDGDGKKMEHTSFRSRKSPNGGGITFSDTYNDVSQALPKTEQLNLAATALVSQLFNNGINSENQDFIKSFKQRFNAAELTTLKEQIRSNPLFRSRSDMEINKLLKHLSSLWGENPDQQAEEPRLAPNGDKQFKSPDHIFFQTTFNAKLAKTLPA